MSVFKNNSYRTSQIINSDEKTIHRREKIDADVLFISCTSFDDASSGGGATFAKHMLRSFGSRLAIVGLSEGDVPIGRWCRRQIFGQECLFFGLLPARLFRNAQKRIIPGRLRLLIALYRNMRKIRACGLRNVIVQFPEALVAITPFSWKSVCYILHGVNNPFTNSRYRILRPLGCFFEPLLAIMLDWIGVDVVLAAADERAINDLIVRSRFRLKRERIVKFPTCVDQGIFRPYPIDEARKSLKLPSGHKWLVSCGRISWIKGWDLLLNTLQLARKKEPNLCLIFVGDGEDREYLLSMAESLGIRQAVWVTGIVSQKEVAMYLNAADVCLVASHCEGWSIAMIEMLACGKPLVTTDVSGASDLVKHEVNGFIVRSRDPEEFSHAIFSALSLPYASETSLRIASEYSVENLYQRLEALWTPLVDNYFRGQQRWD